MMKAFYFFSVLLIVVQTHTDAQQLLLVTKDRVSLRFSQGDPVLYLDRTRAKIQSDVIVGFMADNIILRRDTIGLAQIRGLGNPSGPRARRLQESGSKLLIAGVLLGLGDFINVSVVQNKVYEADGAIIVVTAALVSVGVILLTSKPVVKINRRNRLLIVPQDSPLYR